MEAMHAGHMMPATDPQTDADADTDNLADCHTDTTVQDCTMADAEDAGASAKPAKWQPEAARLLDTFALSVPAYTLQSDVSRFIGDPPHSPPATP